MIPIALFGWPIVVIALFAMIPPRIAAATAFIGGWLFLPMAGYEFAGLPGFGKIEAASYGALIGVLLFDSSRLARLQFRWIDVPLIVYCITPLATSLANGLGAYDGLSLVWGQAVSWGVPYLLGRLYFADVEGLRTLAVAIVVGGLLYVPLCLLEIRLSPRLHIWVYGFHQHLWRQSYSLGGWRPTVFMQHGLAVGMWMTTASIVALWLWWTGALRRVWAIPLGWLVPAMFATAILCKSAGAITLLIAGCLVLAVTRTIKSQVAFGCLLLMPMLYMGVRAPGIWDGSSLLAAAELVVPSKEGSLRYRIEAENILAEHALRQPILGWGGHGRNRPSRMGHDVENLATDGFWIITLGQRGAIGLIAVSSVILLPPMLFFLKVPIQDWWHPKISSAAVLSMILILFMIDSLFNAMLNPVFVLAAGGLSGWLLSVAVHRKRIPVQQPHVQLKREAAVSSHA